jgi:hypothetical protein
MGDSGDAFGCCFYFKTPSQLPLPIPTIALGENPLSPRIEQQQNLMCCTLFKGILELALHLYVGGYMLAVVMMLHGEDTYNDDVLVLARAQRLLVRRLEGEL